MPRPAAGVRAEACDCGLKERPPCRDLPPQAAARDGQETWVLGNGSDGQPDASGTWPRAPNSRTAAGRRRQVRDVATTCGRVQNVTTARHGAARLLRPAEARCCVTARSFHVEARSDIGRFGLLALHHATFLTSQHVSEAGPSRVQAPVGTAGRVPDAAKRPNSRTRQAFPQTQATRTTSQRHGGRA